MFDVLCPNCFNTQFTMLCYNEIIIGFIYMQLFLRNKAAPFMEDVCGLGTDPGRGLRGPKPTLSPKKKLVCKIFKKRLGPPWFLARALTSTIPIPAGQPRKFQEPMKTLKKYIYVKKKIIIIIINKKKKKKKKTQQSIRLQNQTEKTKTKEKKKKREGRE